MSNESTLKKEFKHSDVERIRNIVKKDFTSKTKSQIGYQKSSKRYKEGDIWEEGGKSWTIKKGIRQNITKLDDVKKAIRIPLSCPKCGGPMRHHLAKKMYKIHGFCFDCTIDYESQLKEVGLYKQYEKRMMQGNMKAFIQDMEDWVLGTIDVNETYVTEQGDVEDWGGVGKDYKEKVLKGLKEYIDEVKKHID
jgi:bacterioferritin-associated ferredoxin